MSSRSTCRGDPRQWRDALVEIARSGILRPPGPRALARVGRAVWTHGATLATAFAVSAARYPQRPAVIDDEGALSYAELYEQATALCAHLFDGARPTPSAAILCRNHRGFVLGMAAAAMAGAEIIAINTELPARQLQAILARHDPDVLVHDTEYDEALRHGVLRSRLVCANADGSVPGDDPLRVLASTPRQPRRRARRPGRITLLTSGTTGLAKGVPRSVRPWGLARLAATGAAAVGPRPDDVVLVAPPFFHGFGLLGLLGACAVGATVVCHDRFDAEVTLEDMQRRHATLLFAVPVMLQRLLQLPDLAARTRNVHLRRAVTGAAPVAGTTVTQFDRMFGGVLVNGYGSTEAGIVTIATSDELRRHPSTVGRPALGVSIRIADDEGDLVRPEATGRILVRGPLEYSGYIGEPGSATDPTHAGEGYVDTGDVGWVDRTGLLFLAGRSDDMVVCGGENVFPREVEDAILTHPTITDAIVIGVDDEEFGQVLKAYVVVEPDSTLDVEALKSALRASLERYKLPKRFERVKAIPRNPSGKVLRHRLAELPGHDEETA